MQRSRDVLCLGLGDSNYALGLGTGMGLDVGFRRNFWVQAKGSGCVLRLG